MLPTCLVGVTGYFHVDNAQHCRQLWLFIDRCCHQLWLVLFTFKASGKTYVIKIHYTAYLKDNLKAFYRSVYKDRITGEEEFIAVTQFAPTDARRAFPCFDEPGLKATYQVVR